MPYGVMEKSKTTAHLRRACGSRPDTPRRAKKSPSSGWLVVTLARRLATILAVKMDIRATKQDQLNDCKPSAQE